MLSRAERETTDEANKRYIQNDFDKRAMLYRVRYQPRVKFGGNFVAIFMHDFGSTFGCFAL